MSSLKEIKAHMKGYRSMDLAARDVLAMHGHYKDLKIGSEQYIFPEGKRENLFRLKGTIPVQFRGTTYNIPIVLWLQKAHPQQNPIAYVTPTPDMCINPSRYVDASGRIYLPYISEWKQGKSDLVTLVQILCATFAESIPVFSRQQQHTYMPPSGAGSYRPPPQGGYNPPGYAPHYPVQPRQPYPPPNQPYSSVPYPSGQSSMPVPGGSYNPPYPGGGGYQQPPHHYPPQGQTGYAPYPQAHVTNAQPLLSANEERRRIEEEKEKQQLVERQSLESAVEDKIKRQLQNVLGRAQEEMTTLKDTESKLKENHEKLTKILQDMDNKQREVETSVDTLKEKTVELESIIEYLKSQPDTVNPDETICAANPVYNQILRLYAEENAIDDTIYYLGEALRKSVITHEAFLKHIRDLSRKQFMARATIMKARDAAKLPPLETQA